MQVCAANLIARLVDYFYCRDAGTQRVEAMDADSEVALDTPVALVINATITSALKHTFPGSSRPPCRFVFAPMANRSMGLAII